MGWRDDDVKNACGRVEIFEIAADERLIGAELDYMVYGARDKFIGVTWIKMKVTV